MAAQIEREAVTGVSCVEQSGSKNRDVAYLPRQLRDSGWLPIDRKSPRLTNAYDKNQPQENRATDHLDAPVGHAAEHQSSLVVEGYKSGLADQNPATR